jgi:hypothetical protein
MSIPVSPSNLNRIQGPGSSPSLITFNRHYLQTKCGHNTASGLTG